MKKFVLLLLIVLLSNCGFKVVTKDDFGDYKVKEIVTTGDSRISFDLKKKLINNSSEYSQNLIRINMNVKKIKEIKEKNIQNEITKYEIIVETKVKYYAIEKNKSSEFIVSKDGDYIVSSRYSETLNNEKKLIKNLINDISDQIIKNLIIKLNES